MHSTNVSGSSLSGTAAATPTRPGVAPTSSGCSGTAAPSSVTRKIVEKQEQESPFVLDYYDHTTTATGDDDDERKKAGIRRNDHLAFAIVWSPLPPITWLLPFIGHTGICDSAGIASDFRGPYCVGDDGRMAFGAPTRSLKISDIGVLSAERWDEAIREANEVYRGRMHNICCDNCHSHVAFALNQMPVTAYGVQSWDMVKIAMLVFFRGDFLSWGGVLQQFLPFCVIAAIIVYLNV